MNSGWLQDDFRMTSGWLQVPSSLEKGCTKILTQEYDNNNILTNDRFQISSSMQFHEFACSFMTLYVVAIFIWAAHKNFAVLVTHELVLRLFWPQYQGLLHKLGSYHHLLIGQVSFNLRFTLWFISRWWYELSGGGDKSHLEVVIWVIQRWWYESSRHGWSKAILCPTAPLHIAPYYATTGKSLHSTSPSKSRKG